MTFTHLDADRRPTMVDVSDKTPTKRTATAEAQVQFPPSVAAALRDSGLRSPKGPVFDTAIRSDWRTAASPSNSRATRRSFAAP